MHLPSSRNTRQRTLNVVVDEAVAGSSHFFSPLGTVLALPATAIHSDVLRRADILIVRSRTRIDEALLSGTKVRFVGTVVAGEDHVDKRWLEANNIAFASAPGCNAQAVAEYVIGALCIHATQQGLDLTALTLGIAGVGAVGTLVARYARLIGMSVALYDPPRATLEGDAGFCTFNTLLRADILSLHTPLVSRREAHPTVGLIDHAAIARTTATRLLNTARGAVVDEEALSAKHWDFCAIDCWSNEPYINSHLHSAATLATPHIAGHSQLARWRGSAQIAAQLYTWAGMDDAPPLPDFPPAPPLALDLSRYGSPVAALSVFVQSLYSPWQHQLAAANAAIFEHTRRLPVRRHEWHQKPLVLSGSMPWRSDFEALVTAVKIPWMSARR